MTPLSGRVIRLVRLLVVAACALPWVAGRAVAQERSAHDGGDPAYVLVLNGSDPYLPAFVTIDAAMRSSAERQTGRRIVWTYETLDALRFGADALGPQMAELLARKYAATRIDAVVLAAEPAVEFYLRHRRILWPGAAAIFHSIPAEAARALPLDVGLAGIPFETDYAQTLRIAFALQRAAKRVVVVAGSAAYDQRELSHARAALQPYADRVEAFYLVGLPPAAAAAQLSREPSSTIVLYTNVFRDADGQVYTPRNVLQALSAASAAPVYGVADSQVGYGLAAAATESFADRGAQAGDLVARALNAGGPTAPLLLLPPPSRCVADSRQLQRFRLDEGALPAGCELRFFEPPFLQRYWWQSLLVALAMLAQSALIAALLLQSRRRRVAEMNLQSQRVQLLHASRLAVAGELTASIAHEINQPLGAILSNADAAEMQIQSGQMKGDELLQILADIRRDDLRASEVIKRLRALLARHETERRRFNLNECLDATAAILRAEARRRGITVDYALEASRAEVVGDPVQVQQAVINLVLNAFDACAETPEERRRVRVETRDAAGGVQLSVRDFGVGIAVADLPRVFESFFSTKRSGMGLGLAIARSIVEAHGGTISAARCDVGAEFRILLPVAPAVDPAAQPAAQTP